MLRHPLMIIVLLAVVCLVPLARPRVSRAAEASAKKSGGPLADYVLKEDKSYAWVKRQEGEIGAGKYVELTLTSQTWKDIVWKHQLFVYKPAELKSNSQALLWIHGGRWSDELAEPPKDGDKPPQVVQLLSAVGDQLRCPVAVLLHVPQQPIFDGMVEDEAISHTFVKFYATGDAEWPLLLPMVKSAVRAMDAVQEFAKPVVVDRREEFYGDRRVEARLDHVAHVGGRFARDRAGADGDRRVEHGPADEAASGIVRRILRADSGLHREGFAERHGHAARQEADGDRRSVQLPRRDSAAEARDPRARTTAIGRSTRSMFIGTTWSARNTFCMSPTTATG